MSYPPPYGYGQQQFIQGGVSPNPGGYAYASSPQVVPQTSALAQMMALKGVFGSSKSSSSSSSYPSASKKISIVKYDDHFKEKGWSCQNYLRKPDGSRFTQDELDQNPPLALKYGGEDCPIVVPIPSYKAMCASTNTVLRTYMGPVPFASATPEAKKRAADAISKLMLINFVHGCGYGDRFHDEQTCPGAGRVDIPTVSQKEHAEFWMGATGRTMDDYQRLQYSRLPEYGYRINVNDKDRVYNFEMA